MNKHLQSILINLVVFSSLIVGIEYIVGISYPEIKFPGTDHNLIKENRFGTTRGLTPNAKGLSNGVLKQVDAHGFWEYSFNNNSKKSILFLGDSVTMGIGVESDSTFTGQLLKEMESIQIYNPSVIGYSSQDYLKVVEGLIVDESNEHSITEVNIFWCLNDVYDINTVDTPGFDGRSIIDQFVAFSRNNFKTFHLLKKMVSDRPKSYYLFDKQFYESESDELKKAVQNLIQIDSLLTSHEVNMRVILLPYEFQMRSEGDILPQKRMEKILDNSGIPVYDPYDFLKSSGYDSKDLYLFGDGIHFSETGHKLIAEYLSRIL